MAISENGGREGKGLGLHILNWDRAEEVSQKPCCINEVELKDCVFKQRWCSKVQLKGEVILVEEGGGRGWQDYSPTDNSRTDVGQFAHEKTN